MSLVSKSFSELRQQASNLEALQQKLKETTGKKSYEDSRFWEPTRDKDGNASATIRFLPASAGEELPYVKFHSHSFKGDSGQWYIENCPTTIGLPCPVCEENQRLWKSGVETDKKVASARKRKLSYVANIYVVKDPANPENEGKVFLYKFGAKIFDKILAAISPEFEDDQPVPVFDFWKGANFKLRVAKVAGYVNYDKSSFDNPAVLLDSDEELEAIWKSQYPLSEFTNPERFKSYEDLKKRFDKVKGESTEEITRNIEDQLNSTVFAATAEPVDTNDVDSDIDFSTDISDEYADLLSDD